MLPNATPLLEKERTVCYRHARIFLAPAGRGLHQGQLLAGFLILNRAHPQWGVEPNE